MMYNVAFILYRCTNGHAIGSSISPIVLSGILILSYFYTVSDKNAQGLTSCNLAKNLTNLQNSFTARKSIKFATKLI